MRRKKEYFKIEEGAPPPVEHSIERRVQFSEVDALAISWHGRYPAFFEEAHTELMRKIGLTFDAYREHGFAAPIVQLHVDYFSSLLLDELFRVEAHLHWNDGARLDVSYRIRHEDGSVAATGYTVQMFVDAINKESAFVIPEFYAAIQQRWRGGEFHEF